MKKEIQQPYIINSISELHRLLELPRPLHPLFSIIDMADIQCTFDESLTSIVYNFYSICTKKTTRVK